MKTRYLFGLPMITIQLNNREIEAILDTGFNGTIMLPENLIETLSLEKIGNAEYALADGTISNADIFKTEISWNNQKSEIAVVSSPSNLTLVGMELLNNVKTTLHPKENLLNIQFN